MSAEVDAGGFAATSYRTPSGVPVFRAARPETGVMAALATLDRPGDRVVVVTSPSVLRTDAARRLLAHLGEQVAGVYAGCAPNVPRTTVDELVDLLEATDARTLLSVGGASSVDTAKVCVHLRSRRAGPGDRAGLGDRVRRGEIRHVATPSTLGGAEFTPFAGLTTDGHKRRVEDAAMRPDAVVHAPTLLAETPRELLLGSVGNAMSHCVEGLLSAGAHPVSDALHSRGLTLLAGYARQQRTDHAALADLWDGAALAAMCPVPMGDVHRLVHVIVPAAPLPHGIAHGVLAPHALTGPRPSRVEGVVMIAAATGALSADPAVVAAHLRDVLAPLGIPGSLRAAGVDRQAAERCRAAVLGDAPDDAPALLATFERALGDRWAAPDDQPEHDQPGGG